MKCSLHLCFVFCLYYFIVYIQETELSFHFYILVYAWNTMCLACMALIAMFFCFFSCVCVVWLCYSQFMQDFHGRSSTGAYEPSTIYPEGSFSQLKSYARWVPCPCLLFTPQFTLGSSIVFQAISESIYISELSFT